MKHNPKITALLVTIFILAQLMGLVILNQYYYTQEDGTIIYEDLPLKIERPETENDSTAVIYIVSAILIGTVLLLLLIRFKSKVITKVWFSLAVFIGLSVAFSAFMNQNLAVFLAITIAIWKVYFPNVYISNLGELFVYGGIAAIFHEMLTVFSAALLLIVISIYDMIAVWKIKHMITLAKFQADNKMFAGAIIPYSIFSNDKKQNPKLDKPVLRMKHCEAKAGSKTAMLGGGDIAFPLLFSGAVMKVFGIPSALIIIATSAVALALLFIKAKKDRFYPAMPFISIGCFSGMFIVYLLTLL
jgi:presenilin-like A22 family membrane protease